MNDKKYRVVNREPKPGDLIRLTKKRYTFNRVGDVLPVDTVGGHGFVHVRGAAHPADADRFRETNPSRHDGEAWPYCSDGYEVVEEVEGARVIVETACVQVNTKFPQDADPDLKKWVREKLAEHGATDKKCRDCIDAYAYALNEKAAELLEQYEAEKTEKEMAKQSRVVILSDGKTTTAKLYIGRKQVQEAKAVCSSEDTFNFFEGVMTAANRLAVQTTENK